MSHFDISNSSVKKQYNFYCYFEKSNMLVNDSARRIFDKKNRMNHIMKRSDLCICENKDADQLCCCTADQHLYFRNTAQSFYFLKPKFQASSPFFVAAHAGLRQSWPETPKTTFLA